MFQFDAHYTHTHGVSMHFRTSVLAFSPLALAFLVSPLFTTPAVDPPVQA